MDKISNIDCVQIFLAKIHAIIFGYSRNPQLYKKEILVLFTNVKLLEEISFSQDNGYELIMLLRKFFNEYNED